MKYVKKFINNFADSLMIQLATLAILVGFANIFIFPNKFAFDDTQFIVEWEQTRDFRNLPEFLEGDVPIGHGGVYRPFRSLFYAMAYHLWGINTYGYHMLSFLLALGISFFVYLASRRIFNNHLYALLTAAFFGLHPVHVEAIAFMTASFDSIGLLFFFLAFYLYANSAFRFNRLKALSILCATVAFFTYEMTLTLPFMLGLYNLCFNKRYSFQKNLEDLVPFFLVLLIYGLIRAGLLNITSRGDLLLGSYYVAFVVMLKAFWKYVELLVFPNFLNIHHQIDKGVTAFVWAETSKEALAGQSLKDIKALLGLSSLTGLVAGGLMMYRRNPLITFACFWILIGLLPVSGIVPQASILSERYLFISSFGFAILLSTLTSWIFRFKPVIGISFAVIMLLFFMTKTVERNILWGQEVKFWESAVKYAPDSKYNNFNLALVYQKYHLGNKAFEALDRLEKLEPDSSRVHKQRAVFLEKQGKYQEGLGEIDKAIKKEPKDHKLFLIAGLLLNGLKQYPEAIEAYIKAIDLEPRDVSSYFDLGATYGLIGDRGEAAKYYKLALDIEPYHADSNTNLGIIYMEDGNFQQAEGAFMKAIEKSPKYAKGYYHLGMLYDNQQRYGKATQYYLQTLEIDNGYVQAKNSLGILYAKAQLGEKAEKAFKEVIEADSTFAESYFNLGNLYLNKGNEKLAKEYYEKGLKYSPDNQKVKKILGEI